MKKLFLFVFCVLMLFGCVPVVKNKETERIELGQTEFDGMKITFYKDATYFEVGYASATSSKLYYCIEGLPLNYSDYSADVVSKDKSTRFYADLYGNVEVFDESGHLIPYTEEIRYEDHVIYVYQLKNDQKYYAKPVGNPDYVIMGCEPRGNGYTCATQYHFTYEEIMSEIDQWKRLESYKDYVDYADLEMFISMTSQKHEIGGNLKCYDYYKAELENGNWIVSVVSDESNYYLLDTDQVETLKGMLK